ncbi:pyridoxamine 5'-phosphate oxidase family protein [Acidipropionibacterium jensenii]|uniref:Pyridoxamine 5'-phosphate oxidase family protein n=1 Tax=Acidipropionibacterium jensenii TaxID=1749 RepID=A0A3T0RYJ8_9ACTN|nr:pyridoxamine 5'-phosphate oxidase family protein [Acidipropionibacterium jensenii]AZZ39184.1 pyridoxamine 5'-phosphate oxidase family protein [Acidipropionibacterium jensenii]
MSNEESPMSVVEEDSCWGYLDTALVGRLATSIDDQPQIFPVNYVVDGLSIVFRTAPGSKLDEIVRNSAVAFEADGWSEDGGWSVVLRGRAELIIDPDELALCEKMPLRPWVPTVKKNWVRIQPGQISGRTFAFGPEPTDK